MGEAKPNLAEWAAVVEKEVGTPVGKDNFVSIGRQDQNILFSEQSEDIIQLLWRVAKNIKGTEIKISYEQYKVALIVNQIMDYQRLLKSDSENQKNYWDSKQPAFRTYKSSTMAKHIHAFIMSKVAPEEEVDGDDLFAFLDNKIKT